MGSHRMLLLGKLDHTAPTWEALSSIATTTKSDARDRNHFLSQCADGTLDDVTVIVDRAPASFAQAGKFDSTLVNAPPASVRYICHNGVGYDSIDIAACSARGIQVSNCPNVVEDATADAAIFLILATLRGFNNGILAIRDGEWKSAVPPPPLEHGPQVIYHNRNRLPESEADGARYVSFDERLIQSDVLSLNLPLDAKTKYIISTEEFCKMKPGIIIVNTARGGVLDEDALVQALDSGKVLSAGLAVYQQEHNLQPGLLRNPHVCLLPHMDTSTVETKTKMEELTLANARSAVEQERLVTLVPEQQAEQSRPQHL
ncbi:glyoxylate reductase [Oleoguttula sp. CCFEE 5521]